MRRRHSIVGPMILILLGALFLAENLQPEWISFRMIAIYWPYVLIAWGLLRLTEILYWRLSAKPVPLKGISGGEWTLIVLICLIGSGLHQFHLRAPGLPRIFTTGKGIEMFGEAYDFPIDEHRSAAKVARIVVENARGNTRIVGSDTQEVKVGGRRSVRAFSRSDADQASKLAAVKITAEGDQLVVRTGAAQGAPSDARVSTDLEITVPRGVSIKASGRNGDFDVLNIDGGVDITSDNAGVRLQDIAGNARVDLRRSDIVRAVNVKGNVDVLGRGDDVEVENVAGTVTINGYYSGDITCRNLAKPVVFQSGTTDLRIERLPGQFSLTLGDFTGTRLVGPVRLTARSKDVQIQDFQGEVSVSVERGDLTLDPARPPSARIDAATRSGNVELSLPADAGFEISATTRRGRIESEFPGAIQPTSAGAGASLKGTVGRGPAISLTTDRGEISLRKK
ncbi:MAG TPA: DUF4097 family beta strand repeat-containing protein [Bryobacteraceae bacterium]|nr:DUF4097 family beta strand repeat-containing protein [Bryobacteraceae bacterium]